MKRLFIAVPVNKENKEFVKRLLDELRSLSLDAKIERIENVHLTLKFLGDTEESKIEVISQKLSEIAKAHQEFIAEFRGFGFFPNAKNPRVLWLGINEPEQKIIKLQSDIERAMEQLGYAREKKPFEAHLTLARIKSSKNIIKLIEDITKLSGIIFEPVKVNHFILYESILKPTGAEYYSLREFYLRKV